MTQNFTCCYEIKGKPWDPALMCMLDMLTRTSMDSTWTALPVNSMPQPVPSDMTMTPQMWRTMSLEVMMRSSVPLIWMRKFRDLTLLRVEVASTCSTSAVPIPKALATKAPCVAV